MMNLVKTFCFSLITGLIIKGVFGYVRVCYYTNWSQFSPPPHEFTTNRVPAQLCTHVVFAFAGIQGTNLTTTEFNDIQMYSRLARLRRDNPSLQLLLAVGGWAAGGTRFSRLVSNESAMTQFADNLVAYLRLYTFDGANIDWQYPTVQDRGSDILDRPRFTRFLEILRSAFDEEAKTQNVTRLSLSAAVEANITESRTFYEIRKIGRVLDWAFLMAYDFYGDWDLSTGALHHSALNPDIRSFVRGWLRLGFAADKIVLGLSGFGRSFTLISEPIGTGLGQRVSAGGVPGNFSDTRGTLDYGEICSNIAENNWTRIWLANESVPIAFGNTSDGWQWVGYDDRRSFREKASFIRRNSLAGVMLWSLDSDDFTNMCGNGAWPLMRTLARELPFDRNTTRQIRSNATTTTKASSASTPRSIIPDFYNIPIGSNTSNETKNQSSTAPTIPDASTIPFSFRNRAGKGHMSSRVNHAARSNFRSVTVLSADKSFRKSSSRKKQCRISDNFGPTLICPSNRGKQGDRASFFLFCAPGFFAIECSCLPGHFFNRCLSVCDLESNFKSCPIVH